MGDLSQPLPAGAPRPKPLTLPQRLVLLRRIAVDAAELEAAMAGDAAGLTQREVAAFRAALAEATGEATTGAADDPAPAEEAAAEEAAAAELAARCERLVARLDRQAVGREADTGDLNAELTGPAAWRFTDIPLRRRLQTLVVSCLLFFTTMPVCIALGFGLLMTPLWPLMLAYWVFIIQFRVRLAGLHPLPRWQRYTRWVIWRYYRDYFPVRLVVPPETAARFDPKRNYVFGYHPHGVHSFGAVVNFNTDAGGLHRRLPGILVHTQTLAINLMIPFWRELMIWAGCGDASAACLRRTLRSGPGESVALVIGGAEESLLSRPGTNDVLLGKRKGFVKIALEAGAPLVPTYGFGETDTYRNWGDGRPWLQALLKKSQKRLGFAMPLIKGRGWFNYNFGLMPHRRPIITVVGRPVEVPRIERPTQEDIDKWHGAYVDALKQLYAEHSPIYGRMARSLRVVA